MHRGTVHKLFGYPGGKWPIRNVIVSCFPKHRTYVDVFGGSAAILLTKERSEGEIFNDKNQEIVNFFRVVKHRPAELTERSRIWIHSRALWDETRALPPPADEVERAFRFWVLLSDSFGGLGLHFGTAMAGIRSVTHARAYLEEVAERLRDVHVERLDFRDCIRIYDGPETFFYCDPPYPDTRGGHSNYDLLTEKDWQEMSDLLGSIHGRFLLSSNDHPLVRRLFKSYHKRRIDVVVSLSRFRRGERRRELLISNFKLPGAALHGRERSERHRAQLPGAEKCFRRGADQARGRHHT